MPQRKTVQRARKKARQGKAPTTQAGEFVREEFKHIRQGLHGATNVKQAIAIGLSKARKAGVPLPSPSRSKTSRSRRKSLPSAGGRVTSAKRSRVMKRVLQGKPRSAASTRAISAHARKTAQKRGGTARVAAARKGVRTKGPAVRRQAAIKAARGRAVLRRARAR